MNAVSYSGKKVLSIVPLYAFLIVCIAQGLSSNLAFSQQMKSESPAVLGMDKELTQEAKDRIASTIASIREAKSRSISAAEAAGPGKSTGAAIDRIMGQVDLMYSNTYFDTQTDLQYSFPEDSHDFCRAYFGSSEVNEDIYLNSTITSGTDLSIQLTWTGGAEVTDYDLYLFDSNGKTVGDATGVFPDGQNGTSYQFEGDALTEVASVQYNGAVEENLLIVVDRFRGPGGSTLTLAGPVSEAYDVLEYTLDDVFEYYDASDDSFIGTIENNGTVDISLLQGSEVALVFATDDCAESVQFVLTNTVTGQEVSSSIDNDLVYSIFGGTAEDLFGDTLPDGTYQLTATPYSGDDAQGVQGPVLSVSFEVVGSGGDAAEVTEVFVVDPLTDDVLQVISNGDVVDLTTLPAEINIRATLVDPDGIATGVQFNGAVNGVADAVVRSDNEAAYSLFESVGGVESVANPGADGSTILLGAYELTAAPIGGPDATPEQLTALSVQFEVVGPRIENYTLIDTDTKLPIEGFDPIAEGATINLAGGFPTNLNIRANTADFNTDVRGTDAFFAIGYVDFTLVRSDNVGVSGVNPRESFRPYSVFGDNASGDVDEGLPDYFTWESVCNETYTLTGSPFSDMDFAYGTQELTFTVEGSGTCTASGAPSGQAPENAQLLPNFPNPFNPVTTIQFGVPETMSIKLVVYDMTGREVKRLVDDVLSEGYYDVTFDAGTLSSGMYMYRLETPESVQYRLMTLLK